MGLQEFRGEQENNVQTVQHERSIKKLYLRTPINNTVYTSSVFIQINQTIVVFVIKNIRMHHTCTCMQWLNSFNMQQTKQKES